MNLNPNPALPDAAAARVRFESAYRVLNEAIAARAFPGCAFGVFAEGEVVLEGALGRFTYEADSPEVTAGTVYDIASLTKVVATTAMAMVLEQRGQLDLETPLGEVLPGFVAGRAVTDLARRVTLRHLLAHSSGLPGYVQFFKTAATAEALMEACLKLPIEAEPGARVEYSDPGFILMGKALDALTGEKLDDWAGRGVFARLGMEKTGFCPARRQAKETIPPTEEDTTFRHRRIQGEVQDENAFVLGGVAGHSGVFSDVADLLRFSQEVLSAGTGAGPGVKGGRLFERKTVERFAERQGPEGSSPALGWDTPSEHSSAGRHFSSHSIGHLGYSGCSFWIDLDAGVAIVLLTNRTWPDRQSQLIKTVRPAFHDAIREAL
jgi:CubicO group peptidase (beta-lactamase class C family)